MGLFNKIKSLKVKTLSLSNEQLDKMADNIKEMCKELLDYGYKNRNMQSYPDYYTEPTDFRKKAYLHYTCIKITGCYNAVLRYYYKVELSESSLRYLTTKYPCLRNEAHAALIESGASFSSNANYGEVKRVDDFLTADLKKAKILENCIYTQISGRLLNEFIHQFVNDYNIGRFNKSLKEFIDMVTSYN